MKKESGSRAGAAGPTKRISPAKGGNKTVKTKPGSCPHESKGAK